MLVGKTFTLQKKMESSFEGGEKKSILEAFVKQSLEKK